MNTAAMPVARRIAALPSLPALPFPGDAQQRNPRTVHQAMKKWSGQYGPIFLTQLRLLTGAAPEEAMDCAMAPTPLAIALRQRGASATRGKSNSPMHVYVNA